MRIVIIGFSPFGGDVENASAEAVTRLAAGWSGDIDLVVAILPVAFAAAPRELRALVDHHRPDAVLAIGEAGVRSRITPERYGRNRMDARIADEIGDQPHDEPVDDGPMLRPATIDVDELAGAIRALGLPAEVSEDAGGFVCNRIAVELAQLSVPAAFVHVPALRSRGVATVGAETDAVGAAPTDTAVQPLTFDDLARALGACVEVAAANARRRRDA